MSDQPSELGVKEAAEFIGVTPQSIRNYFDDGILKGYRKPTKSRQRRIYTHSAETLRRLIHQN